MGDFDQYLELAARLAQEERLIPSPNLYDVSMEDLYAAFMNRLAQPLPDGSESPFSSQAPTTAHAILAANLTYFLLPFGRELNLVPDKMLLEWLRCLGAEVHSAQFPIIQLVFTRHRSAIAANIPATVPAGTEITSNINNTLVAVTQEPLRIEGTAVTAQVPARLNVRGAIQTLKVGEFSVLPRSLNGIEAVRNDGTILNPGMESETLSDAVERVRNGIRTGSNGGIIYGRCVTDRDYLYWAEVAGAEKVTVVRGVNYAPGGGLNPGYYPDLLTIAIYPESRVEAVSNALQPIAGGRYDMVPAHVVPINGALTLRCAPTVSQRDARNLAAIAIRDQVNPPHGYWGDTNYAKTVAAAVENMDQVYAVEPNLKHAETGVPLSELDVHPWTLFEIQGSLNVELG